MIHGSFRRIEAPGTGRAAIQLTEGEAFCYPLYYFVPSMTDDGRCLVYHRETPGEPNEIQLHRLDLTTGEDVPLTRGACQPAEWRPWGVDPARGVLGDRAALSVPRGELVYFEGRQARVVNVHTLAERELLELPEDRYAMAQNCVTTDGRWFVYVHVDREKFERLLGRRDESPGAFREFAHHCDDTELCAIDLETGEQRTLVYVASPIHHVLAFDERHVVFCHPSGEKLGMMLTDLDGGWWKLMRTRDAEGGRVCHYVATERGIAYEVVMRRDGVTFGGLYNPFTDRRREWRLPDGTSHTGCDPTGRTFFYERDVGGPLELIALRGLRPDGEGEWLTLSTGWRRFGDGQKTHCHPRRVLDGRYIQMVGGDERSRTNHIFLLDASDVEPTDGVPDV